MSSVIGWYLRWMCCPRPRPAAPAAAALEMPSGKEALPADWAARLASGPPEKELRAWSMEPRLTEPWSTAASAERPWTCSLGLRGRRIWLPAAEPQQMPQTTPEAGPAGGSGGRLTGDDAIDHHLEVCLLSLVHCPPVPPSLS